MAHTHIVLEKEDFELIRWLVEAELSNYLLLEALVLAEFGRKHPLWFRYPKRRRLALPGSVAVALFRVTGSLRLSGEPLFDTVARVLFQKLQTYLHG